MIAIEAITSDSRVFFLKIFGFCSVEILKLKTSTKSLDLCRECTEKKFSTFTFPYFLSIISQDFLRNQVQFYF